MDNVKKPQAGKAANQNRADTEKHHRFLRTLENIRRLALRYLQSQVDDLIEHLQKVSRRQELEEILDSIDGALEASQLLRQCCQQGDRLSALIAAFGLLVAVDSAVLLAWEKPAARGRRILESAAAGGHCWAAQRASAKAARWAEYRREAVAIRRQYPRMSKRSLYAAVGRKFGVSASTIRRHVEKD